MPKADRTGPMGTGAMSGRAAGYCAGFDRPGHANPTAPGGAGMRRGCRRGGWGGPTAGGRGWRHRSLATGQTGPMPFGGYAFSRRPFNPELEKESLRNRSQALQSELEAVSKRLVEIASQEKAP
jgi:Family of unknown function (DUF5320)